MTNIIQVKQAELQKHNRKGFTLMEMLIVVAIIAVLVAIAIPLFMGQLNKAKVAADAANIRSGYSSATAKVLSNNVNTDTTYTLYADGNAYSGASGDAAPSGVSQFKTTGSTGTGTNDAIEIGGVKYTWEPNTTVTIAYTAPSATNKDGSFSISGITKAGSTQSGNTNTDTGNTNTGNAG